MKKVHIEVFSGTQGNNEFQSRFRYVIINVHLLQFKFIQSSEIMVFSCRYLSTKLISFSSQSLSSLLVIYMFETNTDKGINIHEIVC